MNADIKKRYDRKFLEWDNKKILSLKKSDQFVPKFHIWPLTGLLNDPNCVYFKNGIFNIMFQHHLLNPIHGLKTMSLAQTKNFHDFDYHYMVNKPTNDFESHGIYTGNAINWKNKVLCLYTGNARDEKWVRTSYVVVSFFDEKTKTFINKKPILNNFDYQQYTEHFRDPYVFVYKNKIFFLLGAQTIKEEGVILLFELSQDFKKAKLINEFFISKKYRMIECPNLAIFGNQIVLLYSPQYKQSHLPKNENPDIVRYLVLKTKDILENKKPKINLSNKKEEILDYGLEFYAPQIFLKDKTWCVIGWSGIPTSNNYPETKYGWIFVMSMIKEMKLVNKKLILNELPIFRKNFDQNQKQIFYEKIDLWENQSYFIEDSNKNKLEITFKNNDLIIKRYNDKNYFPYNSEKNIKFNVKKVKLEIFFDNSIIEIKINNKYWYTSRLYLEGKIITRRVYE